MKRCKDCRFWVPCDYEWINHRFEHQKIPFGRCACSRKLHYDKYYDNESPPDSDVLFYHDAERFQAELYVGPDFGCVHFVQKEVIGRREDETC